MWIKFQMQTRPSGILINFSSSSSYSILLIENASHFAKFRRVTRCEKLLFVLQISARNLCHFLDLCELLCVTEEHD